eukprot:Em0005g71a
MVRWTSSHGLKGPTLKSSPRVCTQQHHGYVLVQDQCSLLSVVKLCLGESLTGQLVRAVPGASLQCSESRRTNPGCLPLPQWDQFGAVQAESKVDCYEDGGQSYSGSVTSSESGSTCQQWSNSTYMTELFPGLVKSKNYCCNPGGLGTRPWCFTDKGRMENCSVPQCKVQSFIVDHHMCRYIQDGYYIGLTGFVCKHERGVAVRQMLKDGVIPLSRLLLETDAPFMTPPLPVAGYNGLDARTRTNEPCTLPLVAENCG